MEKFIMVGCDLHEGTMVLAVAWGKEGAERMTFPNSAPGRRSMIAALTLRAKKAGGARIVFAYEASSQGFGLYDDLTDAKIECHVLAPTRIARSPKRDRNKSDRRDSKKLLEIVRGHVLAGNEMPSIWVPDPQTRDDREQVRARLDGGEKQARLKSQVQMLLKRNDVRRPSKVGKGWNFKYWNWLMGLTGSKGTGLSGGARRALASLLRQLHFLEGEIENLDEGVRELSGSRRYAGPVKELTEECGVGVLTAMVFLTEMGDLGRFENRRDVGAYLGLVPSRAQSGETDRRGHITRQGPRSVRKVLCQAVWSRVRCEPEEKAAYERIAKRNPKHKKIAVVAMMRRLGVRLWHIGLQAQRRAGRIASIAAPAVA